MRSRPDRLAALCRRRWRLALALPLVMLMLAGGAVQAASSPASAGAMPADDPVAAALRTAATQRLPVLVDFYAPWCYSCYFMAKNVEHGPEWTALGRRAVIVKLDADAPDGARWMQRLGVKGLPGYVVLDAGGAELGRIALERTRAQFYPEIDAILARSGGLSAQQAAARGLGAAALAAGRDVLATFASRRDPAAAERWLVQLPPAARAALLADPTGRRWQQRLQLQAAAMAKDPVACAEQAPAVLAEALGCDRGYELGRALACTAPLPAARRRSLFASQRAAMAELLAQRVFVPEPGCADARSLVLTQADLLELLGDAPARAALYAQAIADVERRLGAPRALALQRDRNLADNLRLYLERAGRLEALDALYPKLIAAYPDDYVYAWRHGRSLLERGQPAAALPWLEQAAARAYGVNRLTVAQVRATALRQLDRDADARRVVAEALKVNGPFFPDEVQALKAVLR